MKAGEALRELDAFDGFRKRSRAPRTQLRAGELDDPTHIELNATKSLQAVGNRRGVGSGGVARFRKRGIIVRREVKRREFHARIARANGSGISGTTKSEVVRIFLAEAIPKQAQFI